MNSPKQKQNLLCNRALDAEQAGRKQEAAKLFRQAITCDANNPVPYLFLGYVLGETNQSDAAAQVWSLAADLDPRIINAWRGEKAAADIRERSKIASTVLRTHFSDLHKEAVVNYQRQHPGADVRRVAAAIWCQTHNVAFEYQHPRQRPHLFFVPDLTPIAVYKDEHLPWKAQLEAAYEDIRAEFLAAMELAADEEQPYLMPNAAGLGDGWKPLADSLNWGSFHLYKRSVPNERLIRMFPATLAALQSVPLIELETGPSEILFSVLRGGQRIPPHFGVSNTDVTVHMPIVTTDNSAIRVGDEVHEWEQGKVFGFDDAFEHESWNDSEEPRVNLLFEAWHPELSDDERGAVSATFAARERWNNARSI
jgi:tetratricopeptide (TPR) repeat protein